MNSLRFTLRQLWKNRLFSGLNVLGLAISISACWIIFNIVQYEYSFDRSHPDKEKIYQVISKYTSDNQEGGMAALPLPLATYIQDNLNQVMLVVPLYSQNFDAVSIKQEQRDPQLFNEQKYIKSTVSDYFEMVPYTWLTGNPKTALDEPNQVVLTLSRAKAYFSNLSPEQIIGKTIDYDEEAFQVSGIVLDLDKPSSFVGKEFISLSQRERTGNNWLASDANNILFVKLMDADLNSFLQTINAKNTEMRKEISQYTTFQTWYDLLPLADKHFKKSYATDEFIADKNVLHSLIAVGAFLLLLACINYINLSTSQLPYRAKEIAVRKTFGEKPNRLTASFLRETMVMCFFALLFAFPLVQIFQHLFIEFMPPGIEVYNNMLLASLFLLLLILTVTLLAGLYPAFLINKVSVIDVMNAQGGVKIALGNLSLRKSLIVFQFIIAQVFIVGSTIMASQLDFMMNTELGFQKDAILTVSLPKNSKQQHKDPSIYKRALSQYPEINRVSIGHLPLTMYGFGASFALNTDTGEVLLNLYTKYADTDYLDLYNINLLAGRSPLMSDSTGSIFINETAERHFGFKDPKQAVGQPLSPGDYIIQGVLEDFHISPMRVAIEPMSLRMVGKDDMPNRWSIKLSTDANQWPKAIAAMEKEWRKIYPNAPFEYKFYDQELEALYESDTRQARMINLATAVTIIISCLGLFGLVTLSAYQRTKEIGIRKVLGSSVAGIMTLLSKEYIKLILVAILIACPIAWWAMSKWLQDFVYRIDIPWWLLFATGLATLVIALLSVSYQAFKAARANPVDSLRDE